MNLRNDHDLGPLFAQPKDEKPARVNNPEKKNLRADAAEWIEQNPQVADMFLHFARELAARGRHFGIGLIAERVRYEVAMTASWEEYRVNNNHRAYIARWLVKRDPALEPFLEFREVRY